MDLMETTTARFSPCIKPEFLPDVIEFQPHAVASLNRTGMTPSSRKNYPPWIPFPLSLPVVPEIAIPASNDRQYDFFKCFWLLLMLYDPCWLKVSLQTRPSRVDGIARADWMFGLCQPWYRWMHRASFPDGRQTRAGAYRMWICWKPRNY